MVNTTIPAFNWSPESLDSPQGSKLVPLASILLSFYTILPVLPRGLRFTPAHLSENHRRGTFQAFLLLERVVISLLMTVL